MPGTPTVIGTDPMAALRAELCRQPVPALGGPTALAELSCLLRVAYLPSGPVHRPGSLGSVGVVLPEPVVRRLVRLLTALAGSARALRVIGPVTTPRGRSAVTGRPVGAQHRLRVHVPLGMFGTRLGMFDPEGRIVGGLPAGVLGRGAAGAWRAALLAHGEWAPSATVPVLGLCCPNEMVAVALGALAGPLKVPSATRPRPAPTSNGTRTAPDGTGAVVLRAEGVDDIGTLLTAIGAGHVATAQNDGNSA